MDRLPYFTVWLRQLGRLALLVGPALLLFVVPACRPSPAGTGQVTTTPTAIPPVYLVTPAAMRPAEVVAGAGAGQSGTDIATPIRATPDPPVVDTTPTAGQTATAVHIPSPPTPGLETGGKLHYGLALDLDYTNHLVRVRQRVTLVNDSSDTWDELVFHVSPAYWPGRFVLQEVFLNRDGQPQAVRPALRETMLFIPLPDPAGPGRQVVVEMAYTLNLPEVDPLSWAPEGNTGWGPALTQVGDWYPILIPYEPGRGWSTWSYYPVGDPLAAEVADYDVAIVAPAGVIVAAAGFTVQEGDVRRYHLERARSFAFLASPAYGRLETQANGVPITVYLLIPFADRGPVVAQAAGQALELFAELFGPYPYPELVIAQNGYLSAMEYSALASLSHEAIRGYGGEPGDLLVALVAHEVAHQWWYGLVGNDQVHDPWLDEGLSMMSELLFFEHTYPELVDWWWANRVDRWGPAGVVDASIYDYPDSAAYVRNVYGLAARFMAGLREVMGHEAFLALLGDYAQANAGRLATATDFFDAVSRHTGVDLSPLVETYFRADPRIGASR